MDYVIAKKRMEISVRDFLRGRNVIPVADISLHQNT